MTLSARSLASGDGSPPGEAAAAAAPALPALPGTVIHHVLTM